MSQLDKPTESKPKGRCLLHFTTSDVNLLCDERHQKQENCRRSKFWPTIYFTEGLKKFGDRGYKAAAKEMYQLQYRNCFTCIDVAELTLKDKHKAMEALTFLNKTRDKSIKGRMVYNRKTAQEWLSIED